MLRYSPTSPAPLYSAHVHRVADHYPAKPSSSRSSFRMIAGERVAGTSSPPVRPAGLHARSSPADARLNRAAERGSSTGNALRRREHGRAVVRVGGRSPWPGKCLAVAATPALAALDHCRAKSPTSTGPHRRAGTTTGFCGDVQSTPERSDVYTIAASSRLSRVRAASKPASA